MDTLEAKEESCFDDNDKEFIESLKRKDKKGIIIYLIIILVLIIIGPYIPSRSSNYRLIDHMPYLEATLKLLVFMIIISTIPLTLYLTFYFKDYGKGKKIIVKTKIKKILMKDSVSVEFITTSPYLKTKSIRIKNKQSYLGISVDDYIMISFLPTSKKVINVKKMK